VVPSYAGVERLHDTGDQVQWGGDRLCEGPDGPQFPTTDGKARFTPVRPPSAAPSNGLRLSTRRGKQFNTMVHGDVDPLTGAARDSVLISEVDADRLGLAEGAPVMVRSNHGELRAIVHRAPLRPGNVQVFYPEGNVLLPGGHRDPSGVPDYNTTVEIVME
jgi:anaerobic selenocysteine-containing dehydrogenase